MTAFDWISKTFGMEKENGSIVLYHGTDYETIELIQNEGLKGGDNSKGGNHGEWLHPILFLSTQHHVAEKYDHVLRIVISQSEFEEIENQGFEFDKFVDGIGDQCISIEPVNPDKLNWEWDDIMISSELINECRCDDCEYEE